MSAEGTPPVPVPTRDAATVVLVRDAPAELEVLLLQRHADSRFAPGAFAFPGGRVEAADAPADAERVCRDLTVAGAARILHDVRPPERAIGFWIAVLRELFEETGILLAHTRSGAAFAPDVGRRAWLSGYRARCRREGGAFRAMLAEQGLTLATDRLAYYAHWITPEERRIRYDTRFFVAAAFPDAIPEPNGVEVVGYRWLTASAALRQHRSGEITLPFVTQSILGSLAAHAHVRALLDAARVREIRPIRPRIVLAHGEETLLLPGDPDYF